MLFFFADVVMIAAAARTCEMLPGAASETGDWIVWIESMIAQAGFSFSIVAAMFSASVSSEYKMCSFVMPSLLDRLATCEPDSSPEIYNTDDCFVASLLATCKIRVDFPIPGSPANNMIDPGTIPPPNTRSISSIFVLIRETFCVSMFVSDCVFAGEPVTFFCVPKIAGVSSIIVPHFEHSKHCPLHFWD